MHAIETRKKRPLSEADVSHLLNVVLGLLRVRERERVP